MSGTQVLNLRWVSHNLTSVHTFDYERQIYVDVQAIRMHFWGFYCTAPTAICEIKTKGHLIKAHHMQLNRMN